MTEGRSAAEVTVVIPTRNRCDLLLSHGLRAALLQEDVDLEVIVVDDGSTDDTASRIAEIADPRLKLVRHGTPVGVAGARNSGIARAGGDWVAFLDDDDVWSPRKVRTQLDFAVTRAAEFVWCGSVFIDEAWRIVRPGPAEVTDAAATRLLERNIVPGGSSGVIAKTELVRRVRGFDERLAVFADWDLWIRLALGGKAAVCPDVLVGYVEHTKNMHVVHSAGKCLVELDYLVAKYADERRRRGVELDERSLLQWLADEYRRADRRMQAARVYLRAALALGTMRDLARALAMPLGGRAMRPALRVLRRPLGPAGRFGSSCTAEAPTWLSVYR